MKEIIGGGFEKRVYVDEYSADKVVKVYLEKEGGENKARARFYLGKILHMLFPENFPNIHLSASGKIPFDKHTQKVVMEKKELDQWHKKMQDIFASRDYSLDLSLYTEEEREYFLLLGMEVRNDDKYKELREKIKNIAQYDSAPQNFAYNKKGNIVYVDTVEPWKGVDFEKKDSSHTEFVYPDLLINREEMKKEIMKVQDTQMREKALFYLQKIMELYEEEKKKYTED